ncbi:MAG: MFS transporter, partial [Caldilineaceae bacterium SB0675_bin_29]|nr:MFS transporter [Caldilineaceae bacterium SB0675_bin_29]
MNLRRLSAVSFGHMAIDILNASIAMILAVLAVDFNMSNAQIALGGMAYALMGSLTQPFFGVLADRLGGRWLGAVGLLWTAVFYYAATFAQDYFTLITLMTIASLGSGAFHPQGAMNAGAAGGPKATTGTSVFFLLGQLGLALGPMIAGVLLEEIWMLGPRIMAVATLPFVVWLAVGLRKPLVRVEEEPPKPRPATLEERRRLQQRVSRARAASNSVAQPSRRWVALVAFAVLVALRASVHQIFYGMLPKYFADLGFTPTQFGFMVGVPSVAIALGSMAGGVLGDRYDQPKILLWSLLAATPFSWMMLDIVDG